MTILTLVFFVVVMAFGGLAIDIGRLYAVHGQMQTYVDEMALGAASQLDGQDNAIYRACLVVTANNAQRDYCQSKVNATPPLPVISTSWSFTSSDLAADRIYFLDKLGTGPGPTPDVAHGDSVLCYFDVSAHIWVSGSQDCRFTSNTIPSQLAKYVAVSAVPMTVSYLILPIAEMFGGSMATSSTLQLQATAGYVQETCGSTPMYMCNPAEPTGNNNPVYGLPLSIGQQIKVTDGAFAPGNFGFLTPVPGSGGAACQGLNGEKQLECMLAAVQSGTTCVENGGRVDVQPGNSTSRYDALNVRFDMFGPLSGGNNVKNSDAAFAPALNVEKGLCGKNGCNKTCPNQYTNSGTGTVPLPRDASFTNGIGSGLSTTALSNYWTTVHGTQPPSLPSAAKDRWDVYAYESATPDIVNKYPTGENANTNTVGNAICYSGPKSALKFDPNFDRRELVVAVVNCNYENVHGNAVNPHVLEFVKLFITEPIGFDDTQQNFSTTQNKTLYAEFEGILVPHDKSGLVHSMSVLYR